MATVVADAFAAGVAGVDFLLVLIGHRHDEQRLAEVAGFADQLLPGRAEHGPRGGQVGGELVVAGSLVFDVGGGEARRNRRR